MSLPRPRTAVLALFFAASATTLLAACDDDATTTPTTDTVSAADTLTADAVTPDALGADTAPAATALVVTAAITPNPPTTGRNTLTLTVHDDLGATMVGATLAVDPQMPMHGHGSSETPVVTEVGDGVYTAFPVTFQMPGMWEVTVTATAGALHGTLVVDYTAQ